MGLFTAGFVHLLGVLRRTQDYFTDDWLIISRLYGRQAYRLMDLGETHEHLHSPVGRTAGEEYNIEMDLNSSYRFGENLVNHGAVLAG